MRRATRAKVCIAALLPLSSAVADAPRLAALLGDVEFQALALGRMEAYLDSGGVRLSNHAYLWDRVAVNTGQLQRYGTQPTWECADGRLELEPLEDPEGVNERRAAMGMNTVEEGLAEMARAVCR